MSKAIKDKATYEKYEANNTVDPPDMTEAPFEYEENMEAIEFIEAQYPETAHEFQRLQDEQYALFCRKQMDYGPSNIAMGTELKTDEEKRLSLIGLIVRINDKVQRLINLVVKNNRDAQNEPTMDAFKDLACYGIIAQIVKNGKWGK
jgi:hypothetical protein